LHDGSGTSGVPAHPKSRCERYPEKGSETKDEILARRKV
jgi:hypothetical protein